MKYFELSDEEKQILEDYDKGEFVSVLKDAPAEKQRYESYARNTLNKNRNINLRLSERDVQRLKSKAAHKGLPYQTLAASVLHQYANRPRV